MQTITFNSIDCYDTHGFIMKPLKHVAAPSQKVPFQEAAYKDGGYSSERFSNGRSFAVSGVIIGTSVQDVQDKIDGFIRTLNERDPKQLEISTYTDNRYWNVQLAGEVNYQWRGNITVELQFTLFAADPTGYAASETNDTDTSGSSPHTMNTVAVGGSTFALPVITIDPPSNTVSDKTIVNNTTGDEIQLTDQTEDANFIWKIDTVRKVVEYSTNNGSSYNDGNSLIKSLVAFPTLKPGVSNELVFTGFTSGSAITVDWRNAFL